MNANLRHQSCVPCFDQALAFAPLAVERYEGEAILKNALEVEDIYFTSIALSSLPFENNKTKSVIGAKSADLV